jgi:sulfonate dioxygenase
MAPALIETQEEPKVDYTKSGTGQYKEAYIGGPKVFSKEAELKGTKTQPPAKYPNYLPTWDGSVKLVTIHL